MEPPARFWQSFRLFVLWLMLFVLVPVSTAAQERVRTAYGAVSVQSGLVWLAKQKNLFAKYNLAPEMVYIPGGSINIQALISGNLDISQLTAAPGVAANLEGADIVYIACFVDKLNYQLVTRPEVKSVAELKGKRLGISRFGSAADFGLRVMLRRLGLDPAHDVTILQIGDEPARSAAVQAGNIEGTVMNAPFGTQAQRLKLNIVADSVKMGIPFFGTGLLGSRRVLDRDERKVLNLLRAYLEAIKVLKTERTWSIQQLAHFTRVTDLKAVEEAYDNFKDQLPNVPHPSLEAMQAVVSQMAETSPKARAADARSYIEDRFLRQLENEGFAKRIWQQ
ncbi:MAG TPA: ABC transporter substrate-binding protein [Candidatus Binatia bacterium]|jgi:NitT/TauT family transport system substrate-binding protein